MASTLDSEFFTRAERKIDHFFKFSGMYVPDGDYQNVCSFLVGMDYQSDGQLLKGFDDWIKTRFGKTSPFPWPDIVLEISGEGIEGLNNNEIGLLNTLLVEFFSDKKREMDGINLL